MCAQFESSIINQKTGFFKALILLENFIKPINIYIYAPIYFTQPEADVEKNNVFSISGSGLSDDEAKSKCLGEAIERYCWYYADFWMEQIQSNFIKIRNKAIPPWDYALFSNNQYAKEGFPFIPFREDTKLGWVKGFRLNDHKQIYIPSQLCFPVLKGKYSRICYNTTTGLACSDNYFNAVYSSICEVIERDTFMMMWLNKIKPKLIDVDWRETSKFAAILEFLKTSRYRCLIFHLKNEINIPVCLSVMLNKEKIAPYVAFGMACDYDIAKAISKSVLESLHNLNYLLNAQKNNTDIQWKNGKPILKSFDDHALLYSNPLLKNRLSFITEKPYDKENIIILDLEKELNYKKASEKLTNKLSENRYQVLTTDLTPPEIKNMGLHVIKALIPGFIDIGFNGYNYLGTKRIFDIPMKMGFCTKKIKKINTFPHPFP